eukprot:TRINITY_DN9838_c0_g1_i10.p1 TRINITY_DN9838_c0_g1~~TRINITY_DN9838_c0_g1_i10.p1  ORF type:complete len:275 (+),score=51.10 TRINITY_DN9838_c0_g1_i10:202-1026(+)
MSESVQQFLEGEDPTNLVSLNCTSRNLKTLPSDWNILVALAYLDLSENSLECLPTSFTTLVNLTSLNLSKNLLSDFPPELNKLTSLSVVSLEMNFLENVPEEFCRLPLKLVKLSYNQLVSVPIIPTVRELYLTNNKLTSIPPDIVLMKHLTLLCLENNTQLPETLPSCFGCMDSLKTVRIGGTNIKQTSVPSDIQSQGTTAIVNYFKLLSRIYFEEAEAIRERRKSIRRNTSNLRSSNTPSMKTYSSVKEVYRAWTEKRLSSPELDSPEKVNSR